MASLDIRQLECFIAVAEEGNLSRAAARLHMTQPPLTRRIKRLERDIGVVLFIRTHAGIKLTAPGGVLLERAYRLVALAGHAVERTRLAEAGMVGHLVVGYAGSAIFDTVPRLLSAFAVTAPGVTFQLEQAAKNVQEEAVLDGRMHIGFGRNYQLHPQLAVAEVDREPLVLAVRADHELAAAPSVVVLDLQGRPLVLFPRASRPSFADVVTEMCRLRGFAASVAHETQDVVSALAQVALGGGIAIVPRSASSIQLSDLVFVPLSDAPAQELNCVSRPDDHTPALARLLAFLPRWQANSHGAG